MELGKNKIFALKTPHGSLRRRDSPSAAIAGLAKKLADQSCNGIALAGDIGFTL
jgi:hypothetical protein